MSTTEAMKHATQPAEAPLTVGEHPLGPSTAAVLGVVSPARKRDRADSNRSLSGLSLCSLSPVTPLRRRTTELNWGPNP